MGDFSFWGGLGWLFALTVPLLYLQRQLHREIQLTFFFITRHPALTMGIFALLFLPGVIVHEVSHVLMAWILRVPTGRLSLLPRFLPEGKVQLGAVETAPADIFRDALIGAAPLITGGALVAYLGASRLGLLPLFEAMRSYNTDLFWSLLKHLPELPDFWLWFYLTFTISTTMFPSEADRRAWLPVLGIGAGLGGLVWLSGAGGWLSGTLAPLLSQIIQAGISVSAISLVLHLSLWFPFRLLRAVFQGNARITG